jgi:hypothetical protein
MAVASLVLGIVSLLFAFIVPVGFIGILLGVTGIVLGALALKKEPSGIATGGLVTSIVGASIALMLNLACTAWVFGGKKIFDEISKDPKANEALDDFTRRMKELEKAANKN